MVFFPQYCLSDLKRMPLTAAGAENAPGSVFCQVGTSGVFELSLEIRGISCRCHRISSKTQEIFRGLGGIFLVDVLDFRLEMVL